MSIKMVQYAVSLLLMGCVLASPSVAAEDSVEAKRLARMRKLAESIRVYADDKSNVLAKLQESPIFLWANPQRESVGGMVFLWTHQGRPHATIGIWTYDDTKTTDSYELQSLSDKAFRSSFASWTTAEPGLAYKEFAKTVKPSTRETVRLAQMRQLVRTNFSATLLPSSKRAEQLRFLPTPVYRYTEKPPAVIDGAVFSFAQGTDPEVFVIVEAREGKGVNAWHYAIANQTSSSTEVSFRDKVVWTNAASRSTFRLVMRKPTVTITAADFLDFPVQ